MANRMTYVSTEGLEKLKAELHDLKTVKRRELADRIESAKALGDLSENAEYHEAKDNLAFVEGRIQQINDMLQNVSIIDPSATTGVIRIGSTLVAEANGKQRTFKIVGSNEADPAAGLVSNESPLGDAFQGHSVGDHVEVQTPAGTTIYTVISIS
ncbi:transcription elongation factor GreA [Patescibacteria group bacterium]|nr:transcription elongation factor GreA [Patescibacteria group bacterium]